MIYPSHQLEALAHTMRRLETLAEALDYQSNLEREICDEPESEGWDRGYHNGLANAYEVVAENIRQALKGNVPPMLKPDFHRKGGL